MFEIGGPEVLAYVDMMRRVAAIEGRRTPIVPVPLLSPRLSSRWLALVTDVDARTGRSLIDSMINEVVVRDDSIRELVPLRADGLRRCRLAALGERAPSAAPMTRRHATTGLLPRWLVEKVPRGSSGVRCGVRASPTGGGRGVGGWGGIAGSVAIL